MFFFKESRCSLVHADENNNFTQEEVELSIVRKWLPSKRKIYLRGKCALYMRCEFVNGLHK